MNEKVYEIEQALLELNQPSVFLNQLLDCAWFKETPWNLLYQLSMTQQSPIHHPEGNAWKHTMLVVNEAAKIKHLSKDPRILMWAALLHDIGKPETTRNRKGKITSYNHDTVGASIAREFLSYFFSDINFIESVVALVRWHMEVLYVNKGLPYGDVKRMLKEVQPKEIALLGWCDRMGRTNANPREQKEEITNFYHTIMQFKVE